MHKCGGRTVVISLENFLPHFVDVVANEAATMVLLPMNVKVL